MLSREPGKRLKAAHIEGLPALLYEIRPELGQSIRVNQ